MRKYETLILLSPELTSEERKTILDNLLEIIKREGSILLTLDDWGMRDLAYPVHKMMRGNYVRLEYAANATMVAEFERIIRITDGVFKFITVKLTDRFIPQPQTKLQEEVA